MPQNANAWIFQGNPGIWDVSGGLSALRHWVVRQHRKEIKSGDLAYIWESGAKAGIVAVAAVTSDPVIASDTPAEIELYRDRPPPGHQGDQLRVNIRIEHVLKPRLSKPDLKEHPILRELGILRNPRGTNFRVTPEQAAALEALVSGRTERGP